MMDKDEIRKFFDELKVLEGISNVDHRLGRAVVMMGDAGILVGSRGYCDERASSLFEREAADPDANYALRLAAHYLLLDGKPLPPKLASFVANALVAGKPARRGRPATKYFRNLLVTHLVKRVCDENGLSATRGDGEKNECDDADESDKISACKFVADALTDKGFTERLVEEIWGDRGQLRIRVPQPPRRRNRRPA